MISKNLKAIFLVSIPIFIVHGLEEYFTNFYTTDSFSKFAFRYFEQMSVPQATFLLFQIMFWLLLTTAFLLISSDTWPLHLMTLFGLIYVFELHHIVKAVIAFGYYPGSITALLFPIIGFFFWKELLHIRHG